MRTLPLVALLVAAGAARADVWQQAIQTASPDPSHDIYVKKLQEGDELVSEANTHGISRSAAYRLVREALSSYREAGDAEPSEGEPYFRIGEVVYSFFVQCTDFRNPSIPPRSASPLCNPDMPTDPQHAQEVLAAWGEFERRSPLDPRLTVTGGGGLLFTEALLHTHLATRDHLAAAAADYEKILARSDSSSRDLSVVSNLAETYMMLDRLDEAIETYREAIAQGADISSAYGLAVALDRAERSSEAVDVIRAQGHEALTTFNDYYIRGRIFFVPPGEENYYYALASEAWGEDQEAIDRWQAYIKSGAHPEFQPQAKKHLEALQQKLKLHPRPHIYDWRDDQLP